MFAALKKIRFSVSLKHRLRFWVGVSLMVIGICGLALPFVSFGLSRDSGILLQSMPAVPDASAIPAPARTIADRLIIAKQGIDMPMVAWQNGTAALWTGAWLWPNGSRPGQSGNTVIFGHRFRYLPPLSNTLFKLDNVLIGDRITLKWQGKTYTYIVVEKRVIEPTDLSVIRQTAEEEITIITCTPVFSTSHRLVVKAVRI